MIDVRIDDGAGNGYQAGVHKSNGDFGLKTFTEPLYKWINDNRFFSNEEYGIALNQDVGPGGTPLGIHNGTDNAYWTGSNVTGSSVTFNSTARPRQGTQSVYVNGPNVNDVWQFAKGSDQSLANYVSVTMWINVDRRWAGNGAENVAFYGWDTGTSSQVGDSVNLEDYFVQNNNDVWQQLTIPLSDMNLVGQTIDAFRMEYTVAINTSPEFFIDDFQLEETGAPIVFTVEPTGTEIYQMEGIDFTFVDAYDARLADNSAPNLAYDQILGLPKLTSGIVLSRIIDEEVVFSATVTCLWEFLRISGEIRSIVSDGVNTILTIRIKFTEPIELRSEDLDRITIQVSDDLSGLTEFTAFGLGRVRNHT